MTRWSCMAEPCPILRIEDGESQSEKIDREITSAVNQALFHQKTPGHIQIVHVKRNAMGTFTAITHQNTMAVMALVQHIIIITAAHAVDNRDIAVEEHHTSERLKVYTMPLIRYMGKATEGWQKVGNNIHAENEGVVIPIQVQWLANPDRIRERRYSGENSALSVVFVVKGNKVARKMV